MVAVADVVAALGSGVLRTLVAAPGATVSDVVIAEPSDDAAQYRGDLVVGAGVADAAEAIALVDGAGRSGAAGVVLRPGPARARGVRAAARRRRVALLELDDSASLVHLVGVVQDIVDRAAAPDITRSDPGGEADLLALADAAAALVDAPVTIEDAQSRVLAYSTRQDATDTARVSTVLGRRVPPAVVASLRSRGVFRRLARSDQPFLVPPSPALEMPRYVVPVRVGGEWLGAIWAVVDAVPPDDVVAELRRTASVVALHLLRNRALADVTRRLTAERLRAVLRGGPVEAAETTWLPAGPWRVVALGPSGAAPAASLDSDLDAWESWLRRAGWRQPLITDVDERAYALVVDAASPGRAPAPGTWRWLAALVTSEVDEATWVAGGAVAATVETLPGSARTAAQVAALRREDPGLGQAPTAEDQWAALTVARATEALGAEGLSGPIAALAEHDRRRHTAYLISLAAWLDHPGEPTAAARSLGVHVNTLRHRMVRMSEVASLDLDDSTERLALRLQLATRGI
ncbi:MAG TPA: helix-turn-helix domain-containing protein [Lapillicoccus sp.]|nr:helix-turn-helix domain-containing protein [Lapillicoccus sp.]